MDNAVNSIVQALSYGISEYGIALGNGIVKIFINVFMEVDSNGTIIGFNLLGYFSVILIGLGIVILITCILIHKTSEAYKFQALGRIPGEIRTELNAEYYNLLHEEQLNIWRELVFEENDRLRSQPKEVKMEQLRTAGQSLWD